jgi:hypothetical protein
MTRPLGELESDQPDLWDDFSLMQGGPLHRLGWAIGLPRGASGFLCLGVAIALVTWLPLFVLAVSAHVLTTGSSVPFLSSLGTHSRLLGAIPLMFVAEVAFDRRVRQLIRSIVASQLVPAQQLPRLRRALAQAATWRDAWIVEAALVGITMFLIWEGVRGDLPGDISTWRSTPGGHTTLAGWWYGLVSLPLFQFLAWRWWARLLIWCQLLWRIQRLDLQLVPTHPDLAGGLGPFGGAHLSLAPLNFAATSIMAATFAEEIAHGQTDIRAVVLPLAVVVIANTFGLVAPLLTFTPKLFETKHRGLREYGALAAGYTRAFDLKWLRSEVPPAEPLLGSADVQSLADLANAFEVIRRMRLVPIARHQVLLLGATAVAPATPLILFVIPLDELIIRGVHTLFPL